MILEGIVKHNRKEVGWEFHLLASPTGKTWWGRAAGTQDKLTRLTGKKARQAQNMLNEIAQHVKPPIAGNHVPQTTSELEAAILRFKETGETNLPETRREEPLPDDITPDSIIEAVMYREDVLGPRPGHRVLQRHHVGDSRYYVVQFQQPDGTWSEPAMYNGVTTIGKKTLPMDKARLEWWCSFPTIEDAEAELDRLAAKGTVMHSLFAEAIMGTLPDFGTSEMERHLRGHINRQGIDPNTVLHEWTGFFYKAIIGFKQFCHDRRVEFLAVEIVLGEPHSIDENGEKVFGYFAQLDFILIMDRKHYKDGFIKGRRAKMPDKPANGRKPSKKAWDTRRPHVSTIGASTDWVWSSYGADSWERRDIAKTSMDWPIASACEHALEIPTDLLREVQLEVQSWTQYPDAMLPEQRERCIFIVDAKSGKNDFPDHNLQLGLQIPLLRRAFPHLDLTNLRVGNWHPRDWQESSVEDKVSAGDGAMFAYNFIDKTDKLRDKWIRDTLAYWRNHHVEELPTKVIYQGSPNIGTPPSENVRFAPYVEYWTEKIARSREHKFADI